jgi:hypothetical protein
MKLKIVLFIAFLPITQVFAGTITPVTTVTSIWSYNSNGDVTFKVANPIPECIDGYWISKTDVGFQVNFSMILAASAAKSSVVVDAYTDKLWPGSGGKYCKLNSLENR